MWMLLTLLMVILSISVLISVLILKTIEGQPNWLMNMSASSSTDNETETSPSGVTTAQSGSESWQQGLLNHIQAMGNSETEPNHNFPTSSGSSPSASSESTTSKKSKRDKKPTNRFELMDMDE